MLVIIFIKAGTNEETASSIPTSMPVDSRSTGQANTGSQTPSNQSIYIGVGVTIAVVAVAAVAIGIALYIRRNKKRYACQTDLCPVVTSS